MLTFLQNIPLAFYSSAFYRALGRNGKGIGLSFILVVTLLNIGGMAPAALKNLGMAMSEQKELLNILPDIEIKDGVLSLQGDPKQDFTVMNENDQGPFHLVFDIDAKTPLDSELSKEMIDKKIIVWINKNTLFIYNHDKNEMERQDISSFDDIVITHKDWVKASSLISSLVAPSALAAYCILLFLVNMCLAFIGGLFLWTIGPLFKCKIDIQAGMRLAAAAKMPVAFVFLIMTPIPLFQTLFWFGFALFALLSLKQAETEKG